MSYKTTGARIEQPDFAESMSAFASFREKVETATTLQEIAEVIRDWSDATENKVLVYAVLSFYVATAYEKRAGGVVDDLFKKSEQGSRRDN
jgi:hypothetical protein